MCDTALYFAKEHSYFAKNSDRDPKEPQLVYISNNPTEEFLNLPYLEPKEKYINHSYKILQKIFHNFSHQYRAVISRPSWIWGAEMGVNEWGLAIGNEAVFAKEKVKNDGLLGMDILRLALHNCKNAREALEFIIKLIKEYGQGGDGGYTTPLKYHNSFLVKDFNDGFVIETAGTDLAIKRVNTYKTISNAYTITDNYDEIDPDSSGVKNFKARYENRIFTFFSKGNFRQRYSENYLERGEINLEKMINLLRSHIASDEKFKRGMKSICIHSGRIIKSETTSSMVIDYFDGKFIIWFTASPHPCVSLFKPLILPSVENCRLLDSSFYDPEKALDYHVKLKALSKKLAVNYDFFLKEIKPKRDKLELKFKKIMYDNIGNKNEKELISSILECYNLEKEYLSWSEYLIS